MENMNWYLTLNKPFLTPPSSLFAPAWIVLYSLILISLILFLKGGYTKEKRLPFCFFCTQMALNLIWSNVFFGMRNIFAALIVIIFMWIFILLTVITFYKHSKIAAVLLLPYFIWVSFAFYLNLGFYILN
jgi:tryptophan-rich sensory protein